MRKKIIIGLVGDLAAGKGAVAKYLEKKYKSSTHQFSTPFRDVLSRLHLEISRKNIQAISKMLRKKFGQNLLAKLISEDAQKDNKKIVVVDGVRRSTDIEYLSKLPEFKLIYITADIKIRYKRIIKRGQNKDDTNKTFKQFKKDHKAEADREIPKVGKTAEIKINNNGNYKNLYNQIDKAMKEVLK